MHDGDRPDFILGDATHAMRVKVRVAVAGAIEDKVPGLLASMADVA